MMFETLCMNIEDIVNSFLEFRNGFVTIVTRLNLIREKASGTHKK